MRKSILTVSITAAVIAALLLCGCNGGGQNNDQTTQQSQAQTTEAAAQTTEAAAQTTEAAAQTAAAPDAQTAAPGGEITAEQAKQIALNDAGVSEADAVFYRAELDMEDGRMVYEIEFYCGQTEYDYDIDAQTGAIVSKDQDIENFVPDVQTQAPQSGEITEDQALQIAIEHAGVSQDDISRVEVHRDYDDGREIIEVEFHVGRTEYSYDIDPSTGNILEFDIDYDD